MTLFLVDRGWSHDCDDSGLKPVAVTIGGAVLYAVIPAGHRRRTAFQSQPSSQSQPTMASTIIFFPSVLIGAYTPTAPVLTCDSRRMMKWRVWGAPSKAGVVHPPKAAAKQAQSNPTLQHVKDRCLAPPVGQKVTENAESTAAQELTHGWRADSGTRRSISSRLKGPPPSGHT